MTVNLNEADEQRSFEVIPDGTIVTVEMTVRSGGAGADGWLRRSKDGNSEGLDCEFTVVGGEHQRRKFWTLLTVSGTTAGHAEAAKISLSKLRAIIESARGIRPDDKSEAAVQARCVSSYADFDGLRFICRIGVEPAKNGYKAKNILNEVITPERVGWHHVDQVAKSPPAAPTNAAPVAAPVAIVRPKWAQ